MTDRKIRVKTKVLPRTSLVRIKYHIIPQGGQGALSYVLFLVDPNGNVTSRRGDIDTFTEDFLSQLEYNAVNLAERINSVRDDLEHQANFEMKDNVYL